jgi:predicted ATPase/DNA-binding SARP family transcriptional activator
MVRIGLLGGVSVVADGGEVLDVGPAKCQMVLAVLAMSAGATVPVPRLVDLVWGEKPPRTAEKTVQSYVVRLRRGLGADAILRAGTAYRLDLDPEVVDVHRFHRLLGQGDVEAALAEWTGHPLAGLEVGGLGAVVEGLVEQWLGAVEMGLERRVGSDPAATIGPLTELTASYPFREGLWSLLMTALYRVGRQGDALAAFRRARSHLVEELGVEPGRQLLDLESLILGHDEQLRGQPTSVEPPGHRPAGTVTFGFGEVEAPAECSTSNPTKTTAAMVRLDVVVRDVLHRHRGWLFAVGRGSFGAAFHRADDASAWAIALQLAVSCEVWPGGVALRLRVGLHTGEAEVSGDRYFGPAVDAAAQLATVGHGGQVLASAVTAALLERDDLLELGSYHLQGDPTGRHIVQLDGGTHPPLRTAGPRGNLPFRRDRLIGRDDDLVVLDDVLSRSPVVTLLGPGGIGKTSLALAAAAAAELHSPRAAWLIELGSITSSGDVPRLVADTLGAGDRAGWTVSQSIIGALQTRPALLVLDNCEHVLAGAAELVQTVVEHCPGVRVLATSREALGVSPEQLIPVPALPPRSGAELFSDRALAVEPSFDPRDHRGDIEEICRRLDGIPLAIELAAARSRTLTPPDLVARLGAPLGLLVGGRRTGGKRHQTLRATIQWSYDLLDPPQQALFQRLSIFAGPFDLAAAWSVVADDGLDTIHVDDLLGELVERSMLSIGSGPFGRRFWLLETLREFAADRLMDEGAHHLVAGRHAQWCLDQVRDIHELLVGPAEAEGVAHLRQLWPNLRVGFDWACTTHNLSLADGLVGPIAVEVNLRKQAEISDWAERILALTTPADDDLAIHWLAWACYRPMQTGDQSAYESLVQRHRGPDHPLIRYTRAYLDGDGAALSAWSPSAVSWLQGRGENHAAALTELAGVASGLMSTGRFEALDGFLRPLVERYRCSGPPTFHYLTLAMLGYSALFQGRSDQADQYFEESAVINLPERTISVNKPVEARVAFRGGDRSKGLRLLCDHVEELLATDYTDVAMLAAVEFVNMMAALDRLPETERVLGYLRTTGDFGVTALRTLVADAAALVGADAGRTPQPGREQTLDARQALGYMQGVLAELATDPSPTR